MMPSTCYLSVPDGWWERTALESEMGIEIKLDNDIVVRMAAEDQLWQSFITFCTLVTIKSRQLKERNMKVRSEKVKRRRRAT